MKGWHPGGLWETSGRLAVMLPKISLPANAYLSCSVCILSVCFKLQAVPTSLAHFMEQVNELSLTNDA